MKQSDLPTRMQIAFGRDAGGGFIRTVPVLSQIGVQDGAASFQTGFVPDNFIVVGAGGVPPFGQDFNGLMNAVTKWNQWQAAGSAPPVWDSTFNTAVGGYPRGAILSSTTAGLFWINLADDNTTNPDSGGASNWKSFLLPPPPSLIGSGYFAVASSVLCSLIPRNGNVIVSPGTALGSGPMRIPSGGLTFGIGTPLIEGGFMGANSTYFAYLSNAAAPVLQPSVFAPTTDVASGMQVLGGDPRYVLVGMVRVGAASFVTSSLGSLSWFNRRMKFQQTGFTVDRFTVSASYVEVNAEISNGFLSWGDDISTLEISAVMNPPAALGSLAFVGIGFDNTTTISNGAKIFTIEGVTAPQYVPIDVTADVNASQGWHFATLLARNGGDGVAVNFRGAGDGNGTYLTVRQLG